MLMLISVVMEFDMWCNSFTSVNEMFMMMMINWMSNFMMDDLMMVVWSFVMDIVVNFVNMVRLVMIVMIIMIMVHDLMVYGGNMMDVNIMMIKIVMIVEAVIRVNIMVDNMSISEVIELVRVMLPLGLMTEPFHIFMMSVMMVIVMLTIVHILHIVLMILTMHVMAMSCMGWSMHIMNWSWVMDWMSEIVSIIWILSK